MALDYLSGAPMSMPGAVPGASQALNPMAPIPGAIGGAAPAFPQLPLGMMNPAELQYTAETQEDGTVLLRVVHPNGAPGPVVQVIKPPKPAGSKTA